MMRAFVLAAGLGTRLRPFTLKAPKPLIPFGGRPIIEHSLNNLVRLGVEHIAFNAHHLGEQVLKHVPAWALRAGFSGTLYPSDERALLLDTGGGLTKAWTLLGHPEYFLSLNSDTFCLQQEAWVQAMRQLLQGFDGKKMDFLLGLVPPHMMQGHSGKGDFDCENEGVQAGRLRYGSSYVFTGTQVVHAQGLIKHAENEPFPMKNLWAKALASGRLYGLNLNIPFFHVGCADWLMKYNAGVKP